NGAIVHTLLAEPRKPGKRRTAETEKIRRVKDVDSANLRHLEPQKYGAMNPQIFGALNKEEEVLSSRGSTEEKSSSSPAVDPTVQELPNSAKTSDDDRHLYQDLQNLVRVALLEFVRVCGFKMPAGKI